MFSCDEEREWDVEEEEEVVELVRCLLLLPVSLNTSFSCRDSSSSMDNTARTNRGQEAVGKPKGGVKANSKEQR